MNPVQHIADWNVEARREKNADFFVPFEMMDRVIDGRRSLVVGRKGTGKTALSKYILHNYNSATLNFDLEKFNSLMSSGSSIFNGTHEFSKIWKFIILNAAAEKLYRTFRLDYDTSEKLSNIFDANIKAGAPGRPYVKKMSGGLAIPGIGTVNGALERDDSNSHPDLKARTEWFEEVFKISQPESKIYIIFDEIDIDFKSMSIKRELYIDLVVSLVNTVLSMSDGPLSKFITPIVFIRDDLFSMLGNHKNKWSDYTYRLSWPQNNIVAMLTKRLKMATGLDGDSFDSQWESVYSGGRIRNGSGRIVSIEYIQRHTQGRPRDYIAFIREAAREAVGMNKKMIDLSCLENALPHFSDFFLNESNLELEMLFEDYKHIMPVLSKIGKPIFRIEEFESAYQSKVRTLERAPDWQTALEALRDYSVIGNLINNVPLFAYQSPTKPTNFTQSLAVHPGLRKALHIQ